MFFSLHPSTIIENRLYLGAMGAARRRSELEELNIGGVVNCTIEIPNYYADNEEIKLKYKKLNVDDDLRSDLSVYFDSMYDFIEQVIEEDKKAVLVHCTLKFVLELFIEFRCCWNFTKFNNCYCLSNAKDGFDIERRYVIKFHTVLSSDSLPNCETKKIDYHA